LYNVDRKSLGNIVEEQFIEDLKRLCDDSRLQWSITKQKLVATRQKPADSTEIFQGYQRAVLNPDVPIFPQLVGVLDSGSDKILFMPQNCPVIDAAGPGRRVYQITIADKHPPNVEHTKRLLESAGLLVRNTTGDLIVCPSNKNPKPLEFCWVVPPGNKYERWAKKNPVTFAGRNPENAALKACWNKYVEQFVFEIPVEAPIKVAIGQEVPN
jgi:hypothetical protein